MSDQSDTSPRLRTRKIQSLFNDPPGIKKATAKINYIDLGT